MFQIARRICLYIVAAPPGGGNHCTYSGKEQDSQEWTTHDLQNTRNWHMILNSVETQVMLTKTHLAEARAQTDAEQTKTRTDAGNK